MSFELRQLKIGPWERKIIDFLIEHKGTAKWTDVKKEYSGHTKLNKKKMTTEEYQRVKNIHKSLYNALRTLEDQRKLKKGYITTSKDKKGRINEIKLNQYGRRELYERKLITDEQLRKLTN